MIDMQMHSGDIVSSARPGRGNNEMPPGAPGPAAPRAVSCAGRHTQRSRERVASGLRAGSSDSGLMSLARPPQRCGRGPRGTRGRLGCRGVCSRCARRGGCGLSRPRVMRAQRQSPRLGSGQGCGGRESPGCTRHSQRPSPSAWAGPSRLYPASHLDRRAGGVEPSCRQRP